MSKKETPGSSIWSRRVHEPFVGAALAIALTAGFGYAAFLVAALALGIPAGAWWLATVRAHGHAQLFGWMGLYIVGVGLYFFPRLRSITLKRSDLAPAAFWLLVSGILLYSFSLPALSLAGDSNPSAALPMLLRLLVAASGLLELAALVPLTRMLVATEQAAPSLVPGAPVYPVLPLIRMAVASFGLAFLANAVFVEASAAGLITASAGAWDSLIIQLLLYGLAVPVAFVFAVRNLPLYLRLAPPPRGELRPLAAIYAAGLALRVSPDILGTLGLNGPVANFTGAVGVVAQSACILWFVWRIDLLHRRPPWTVDRAPNTRPDLDYLRKPT
ncbi:MAG: hypothetical protein ACM3JD_16140, partial [Rudaea sp.]